MADARGQVWADQAVVELGAFPAQLVRLDLETPQVVSVELRADAPVDVRFQIGVQRITSTVMEREVRTVTRTLAVQTLRVEVVVTEVQPRPKRANVEVWSCLGAVSFPPLFAARLLASQQVLIRGGELGNALTLRGNGTRWIQRSDLVPRGPAALLYVTQTVFGNEEQWTTPIVPVGAPEGWALRLSRTQERDVWVRIHEWDGNPTRS
jgi:hypothetical protein